LLLLKLWITLIQLYIYFKKEGFIVDTSASTPYGKMTIEETLHNLGVNSANGLSSDEAEQKLKQFGPNSLEQKEESIFKKLIQFFWGPIPIMIEIAAVLSALLQRWPDLIVILAMLFINAALGFFQEYKAGNAIAALKKKLALEARVLRNGKWEDIAAKDLVPGDIITIKLGNIIPADIKLISGEYVSIDQSSLTGESLPVTKKVNDIAYSGTIVKLGQMTGVVVSTGMNTFFGKTAKLVGEAKNKSHFQEAVIRIGHFLIFTTLAICAIILVVSLYRLEITHSTHETLGQIVIFILVLVIAGIPVALPAVLSATMAIGASKLAKMKAIVSKLTSIEELASMDILCSDKTGTLTKNQLTVGEVQNFGASDEAEIMKMAYLSCCRDSKDAIDDALSARANDTAELDKYEQIKFTPFDPMIKRTEAILKAPDGSQFSAMKGAPQIVLNLCNPTDELSNKVMESIDVFAKKGYRTLGVAKSVKEGAWEFLGLIPLFDPPRSDTKLTLDHVQEMGVKVKMVTGDHQAIACELSETLGLGTNILSVTHLHDNDGANEGKDAEAKEGELIEKADGFAEVFPEHKFKIVKVLQKLKHVVGMTGDGVNDAPALKQADVGIAVDGAVDAAKEAADLVLTEPGLLVISHAIEEARKIFGRMKSYAMYRISETCRLLFFLLLAMLVFNDHPLTAIMIILIALLNDIPIMMIAYDHMKPHSSPVHWNMKEVLTIAIGLAVVGVISTFGLYWIGDKYWFTDIADPVHKFHTLRTLAFMAILCGGNLTIYLTRNLGTIWEKPLPEWKFFLSTLFSQVIGTFVSAYGLGTEAFIGIGWKYVGFTWVYIIIWFLICMLSKELLYLMIGGKKAYAHDFVSNTSKPLSKS
jgi:H+-transporting ATPase